MIYSVCHRTVYDYESAVSLCQNRAHLIPRGEGRQILKRHEVAISPEPIWQLRRRDYFGNETLYFSVQEPHTQLVIESRCQVDVAPQVPLAAEDTYPWEPGREHILADLTPQGLEACEFIVASPHAPISLKAREYALPSFPPGQLLLNGVRDLMGRIHKDFEYRPESTTVSTPVDEVLEMRSGVCQDFAHLMISCLRSLRLSARYVSGYLLTVPPPGQEKMAGADASHAWVDVFFPAFGWIGFDPTNDCIVSEQHIVLAWGRDYSDVSPVRGVALGGGRQTLSIAVDVAEAVAEEARESGGDI
ncbi:MAG: transglutaminase family protein [Sumerlaeia bacterium]